MFWIVVQGLTHWTPIPDLELRAQGLDEGLGLRLGFRVCSALGPDARQESLLLCGYLTFC